jgi:hypothetical protein
MEKQQKEDHTSETLSMIINLYSKLTPTEIKNIINSAGIVENKLEQEIGWEQTYYMGILSYQIASNSDPETILKTIKILKQYPYVPICNFYTGLTGDYKSKRTLICALVSIYLNLIHNSPARQYIVWNIGNDEQQEQLLLYTNAT